MAQKLIKPKSRTKSRTVTNAGLAAKVALVEKSQKKNLPAFRVGDTVRVHVRIKEGEKERLQSFEGTVIARGNHGGGKAFTVRKISHGIGVERIFSESSPKIGKLEVVQSGKVRRAKLYYLRGLIGKSARLDQDVQTNEAQAASAAARGTGKA